MTELQWSLKKKLLSSAVIICGEVLAATFPVSRNKTLYYKVHVIGIVLCYRILGHQICMLCREDLKDLKNL